MLRPYEDRTPTGVAPTNQGEDERELQGPFIGPARTSVQQGSPMFMKSVSGAVVPVCHPVERREYQQCENGA